MLRPVASYCTDIFPTLSPAGLHSHYRKDKNTQPSPMSWFDHAIRTEDVLNRACAHVWHSGPRFGRPLSIVPSHEIAPCPGAVELMLALESILFGGWCAWLECTLSVTSSHTRVDGIQPCWDLKLWRQWRMTHHKKTWAVKVLMSDKCRHLNDDETEVVMISPVFMTLAIKYFRLADH